MRYIAKYASPLGPLLLMAEDDCLTGLWMRKMLDAQEESCPVLEEAKEWLDAYFQERRPEMTLPLNPEGTAFQKQVWQILLTIPYGQVRTYGDIAREMAGWLGKKNVPAGSGSGGWKQPNQYSDPLSPGGGGERTVDGIRLRAG